MSSFLSSAATSDTFADRYSLCLFFFSNFPALSSGCLLLRLIWSDLTAVCRETRWRPRKPELVWFTLDQNPFNMSFRITSEKDSNVETSKIKVSSNYDNSAGSLYDTGNPPPCPLLMSG